MNKKELESLEHEAQRKIGRNIMNFQKIEFMLKHLISRSQCHGTISSLASNLEKSESDIHKKSLGLLAKDLFNTVYADSELMEPPADVNEPWISFKFSSETDVSNQNDLKLQLENLINNRNELIHHKLHSIRTNSESNLQELIDFLDQQNEDIIPIFEWLQSLGKSMIDGFSELQKNDWTQVLYEEIK